MENLFFVFLFLFGLIIGSFLNVVIFRYDPEFMVFSRAKIGGRSRCRNCAKMLGVSELIPVFSFYSRAVGAEIAELGFLFNIRSLKF